MFICWVRKPSLSRQVIDPRPISYLEHCRGLLVDTVGYSIHTCWLLQLLLKPLLTKLWHTTADRGADNWQCWYSVYSVQLGVKHVTFQSVEWCTSNQPGAAEMINFRPYKDWHHSKTKISYLRHHQNSGILRNNLLQVLCPSQILHHWPKKWQKSNAMYLNKVSQYHTL